MPFPSPLRHAHTIVIGIKMPQRTSSQRTDSMLHAEALQCLMPNDRTSRTDQASDDSSKYSTLLLHGFLLYNAPCPNIEQNKGSLVTLNSLGTGWVKTHSSSMMHSLHTCLGEVPRQLHLPTDATRLLKEVKGERSATTTTTTTTSSSSSSSSSSWCIRCRGRG